MNKYEILPSSPTDRDKSESMPDDCRSSNTNAKDVPFRSNIDKTGKLFSL